MGAAISAMRASLKAADDAEAQKTKQNLEILQQLVDSKLDKFEADLDAKFLNPASTAKLEVPGIRALRKTRYSTAAISDKPAEAISGAVDDFFSIGDQGTETGTAIKTGFKKVVTGALNVFLGNTEAGQKEETKYFIYMLHNAIVRLDVKLWRWNFAGKGFSDTYQSVMGYVIALSIVDVKVLKTSEFVFLISEYAGDQEAETVKYIKKMETVYNTARAMAKGEKLKEIKPREDEDDE